RKHHRFAQSHDGADGTVIAKLTGRHIIGRARLQPGRAGSIRVRSPLQGLDLRDTKPTSFVKSQSRRVQRRRLRADAMEMAERQQKLNRQRKKREMRTNPDV